MIHFGFEVGDGNLSGGGNGPLNRLVMNQADIQYAHPESTFTISDWSLIARLHIGLNTGRPPGNQVVLTRGNPFLQAGGQWQMRKFSWRDPQLFAFYCEMHCPKYYKRNYDDHHQDANWAAHPRNPQTTAGLLAYQAATGLDLRPLLKRQAQLRTLGATPRG